MSKEKEDLRIVRTRKLLSNTLLDLMQEESIEKISVIDLCNKAMINRATFYAHFEDKYHLLNFALDELKDTLYESFTRENKFSDPYETLRAILTMGADFVFDNRNHITKLLKFNRGGKVLETIRDSIANSVKYQLSKYKTTYDFIVPPTVIATFIAGGMINTTLLVLDDPGHYTYDEFVKIISGLTFSTLFKQKQT